MKSLGFHRYAVGAIDFDRDDIARRQKRQDVVELAASRKKLAINPLLVAQGGVLIAGRDRLAAELLNNAADVWCHVIAECSEADILEMEIEENVRRRDVDRDQQLARLVTLTEQAAKDIPCKPNGNAPQKGRPVTPRGEARRKVAEVAKVSVEAVRAAENRAAREDEPPAPKEPAIRLFGLPLGGAVAEVELRARIHQEHVNAIALALVSAQRWLGKAAEEAGHAAEYRPSYAGRDQDAAEADRLLEEVKRFAARVRGRFPAALCPYRKSGCGPECNHCRGAGYSTVDGMKQPIPPELLREGAEAMVSDGRGGFVKVSKVRNGKAAHDAAAKLAPAIVAGMTDADRLAAAKVGLDALIDEATGYQKDRPKDDLRRRYKRETSTAKPSGRHIGVTLPDGRVVDPNEPPPDISVEVFEDEEIL